MVLGSSFPGNRRSLLATLEASASAMARGDVKAGTNLLRAFQNKVRAQMVPNYPVAAEVFNCGAQQLIDEALTSIQTSPASDKGPQR
jgi:hypothetical protein